MGKIALFAIGTIIFVAFVVTLMTNEAPPPQVVPTPIGTIELKSEYIVGKPGELVQEVVVIETQGATAFSFPGNICEAGSFVLADMEAASGGLNPDKTYAFNLKIYEQAVHGQNCEGSINVLLWNDTQSHEVELPVTIIVD